jgi:hypothetical protein
MSVPLVRTISPLWMSYVEASPARISRLPGQAPGCPVPVQDSGGRWLEPFAWYDRPTRSWRTWQRSLFGGWEPFSETWPRAGMTRNGIAYQRRPLAPLTKEIASGSWRTPGAGDGARGAMYVHERAGHCLSLRDQVKTWPTPRAEHDSGGHRGKADTLHSAVKRWPTPTTQDASNNGAPSQHERNSLPLNAAIGGALNPTWVEWLMGYPLGWTDCGDSATRSSRKSRNGSDGA